MRKRRQAGFTLIELMVALAVFAILVTVAVPSFRTVIENNNRETTVYALLGALQLARSEAIKRSEHVKICVSSDGAQCSNSSDWSIGWIVFSDLAKDGDVDNSGDCATDHDCILRVAGAVDNGISVAGPSTGVAYLASGLVDGGAAQTFQIKINDCTSGEMNNRQVQVTVTGQPHITEAACS